MPARAQSDLDLANLALGFLKEDAISSFDEPDRTAARVASQWYGTAIEETLRETPWNFATAWFQPAMDTSTSPGPLKNRFPLPPECVAVRQVTDQNGVVMTADDTGCPPWEVETATVNVSGVQSQARVLVTNATSVLIKGTQLVTNIGLWDADAVIAAAARLAEYMAPQLGRSTATAEKMAAKASEKVDDAEAQNARDKPKGQISRDTSWTRARRVGYRGNF